MVRFFEKRPEIVPTTVPTMSVPVLKKEEEKITIPEPPEMPKLQVVSENQLINLKLDHIEMVTGHQSIMIDHIIELLEEAMKEQ